MFSEKAKDIMDTCRFCWMCRHVCPVAAVTGNEANTPRARGLVLSMDSRGLPFNSEAIDVVFQCCLCSACTNNCVTGYDPTVFTREARSIAIANGLLPSWLRKIVDKALEGELKFVDEAKDEAYATLRKTFSANASVLLYRGGYTASAVPLMKVLQAAKVDYFILDDELPTGSHLGDLVGFVEDVRSVAERWIEQMVNSQAKKVVVLNPTDAAFIKQQMAEWKLAMPFAVETATAFVANLVAEGALTVKPKNIEVTFNDPSRLARILDDTSTPRTLLQASNVIFKEMFLHGKLANSTGSALMNILYPKIVALMVESRWKEILRTGTATVVTASPENAALLRTAVPEGGKVVDIFSLLLD